jgi:hypothetical protein
MTQQELKNLFYYENGFLFCKIQRGKARIGEIAGSIYNCAGQFRRVVGVNRKRYLASRLIFLYHFGVFPKEVDHIDNDTLNDTVENLRAANRSQNMWNRTANKRGTSKYKGVSFCKNTKKWTAQIQCNKVLKNLGKFDIEEDAAEAYKNASIKLHGEFGSTKCHIV